ncbi:response regulator transcription factor [Sphingomonas oligophenolica]|uniref:Response regulator n=1 Tax=Sphingomonas oligophenolica TaxID=301154 RepID=A0ABU9Y3E7_9SPHN
MRLLIVEDDRELAAALASAFARRSVSSDRAETAGDAELMLASAHYAAIVLDLGLPDGDGLVLLQHLRAHGNPVPIIILTARSDLGDRVSGLDAGADDYLIKPFEFDELFARLTAVLRRKGGFQGNLLTFGNLQFDIATRELLVDGVVLALSVRETELVELLLRRDGRVVPKRLAEDQLFGMNDNLGSNAVEVYVHRLRQKLERAGAATRIDTIRGVGYLMRLIA